MNWLQRLLTRPCFHHSSEVFRVVQDPAGNLQGFLFSGMRFLAAKSYVRYWGEGRLRWSHQGWLLGPAEEISVMCDRAGVFGVHLRTGEIAWSLLHLGPKHRRGPIMLEGDWLVVFRSGHWCRLSPSSGEIVEQGELRGEHEVRDLLEQGSYQSSLTDLSTVEWARFEKTSEGYRIINEQLRTLDNFAFEHGDARMALLTENRWGGGQVSVGIFDQGWDLQGTIDLDQGGTQADKPQDVSGGLVAWRMKGVLCAPPTYLGDTLYLVDPRRMLKLARLCSDVPSEIYDASGDVAWRGRL